MKTRQIIITAAVLANAFLLTGINFAQETKVEAAKEKVKEAKTELKEAKAENDKDYREFKTEVDLKISNNEKKIADLKVKINASEEKDKANYEKKVDALELRNTELKKKIADYKYEGGDQWVVFKRGFNKDLKSVGKAIKNVFSKKD